MKLELKKGLPIEVLFFAVTTLIFAVLTLFNLENLLLRIMTQASACLLMIFKGMHIISHQKEKLQNRLFVYRSRCFYFRGYD